MITKIVVFSHKTDEQRKKNFAFRSAKNSQKFANGNRTNTVLQSISHIHRFIVTSIRGPLPIPDNISQVKGIMNDMSKGLRRICLGKGDRKDMTS